MESIWIFSGIPVMTSQGKNVDDNNAFIDAIDDPVFFIEPS